MGRKSYALVAGARALVLAWSGLVPGRLENRELEVERSRIQVLELDLQVGHGALADLLARLGIVEQCSCRIPP
jgi:hypothetical protein